MKQMLSLLLIISNVVYSQQTIDNIVKYDSYYQEFVLCDSVSFILKIDTIIEDRYQSSNNEIFKFNNWEIRIDGNKVIKVNTLSKSTAVFRYYYDGYELLKGELAIDTSKYSEWFIPLTGMNGEDSISPIIYNTKRIGHWRETVYNKKIDDHWFWVKYNDNRKDSISEIYLLHLFDFKTEIKYYNNGVLIYDSILCNLPYTKKDFLGLWFPIERGIYEPILQDENYFYYGITKKNEHWFGNYIKFNFFDDTLTTFWQGIDDFRKIKSNWFFDESKKIIMINQVEFEIYLFNRKQLVLRKKKTKKEIKYFKKQKRIIPSI